MFPPLAGTVGKPRRREFGGRPRTTPRWLGKWRPADQWETPGLLPQLDERAISTITQDWRGRPFRWRSPRQTRRGLTACGCNQHCRLTVKHSETNNRRLPRAQPQSVKLQATLPYIRSRNYYLVGRAEMHLGTPAAVAARAALDGPMRNNNILFP